MEWQIAHGMIASSRDSTVSPMDFNKTQVKNQYLSVMIAVKSYVLGEMWKHWNISTAV